ncbi:fused MFS/spermidine synthase [Tychonema sp. LEGE 07199]|uniref:spermidine synthase n=1 Tax=unclassified Tychonema TaxID=2642144 RepID=UPI00187E8929|nr:MULTISPECIES: fused MFS/spermidine synthase [unclassified Tychonema]MBE9120313.1 fused MFS/spermidine synthase [Tychonema sp. LEGE 07199]MBE9131087.1 fused MFS/spermidine synthase [Tychonema sp. LEGE 07196]
MSDYLGDRQNSKVAAIRKQINWLQQQPDGTLFQQNYGENCIAVKKIKSFLLLLLADTETFTTKVAQSILDLNNPLNLIFPYARAMMLALVWKNSPQKIYIIGFGGGSIPNYFHHYFPDAIVECTDIDPIVVEVAQKFFGIQLDDKLKVTILDGREYLAEQNTTIKNDIILVDAGFGSGYMPYKLVTQEFYQLCKTRLSSAGAVVVNLFHKQKFNAAAVKTLQSVFAQVYLFNLDQGNTIAIATNAPDLTQNEIFLKAEIIQDFYNLEFSLIELSLQLKKVAQLPEWVNNWDTLPIFTDAAIPAEYFD